jgi:hypothetical protein
MCKDTKIIPTPDTYTTLIIEVMGRKTKILHSQKLANESRVVFDKYVGKLKTILRKDSAIDSRDVQMFVTTIGEQVASDKTVLPIHQESFKRVLSDFRVRLLLKSPQHAFTLS